MSYNLAIVLLGMHMQELLRGPQKGNKQSTVMFNVVLFTNCKHLKYLVGIWWNKLIHLHDIIPYRIQYYVRKICNNMENICDIFIYKYINICKIYSIEFSKKECL